MASALSASKLKNILEYRCVYVPHQKGKETYKEKIDPVHGWKTDKFYLTEKVDEKNLCLPSRIMSVDIDALIYNPFKCNFILESLVNTMENTTISVSTGSRTLAMSIICSSLSAHSANIALCHLLLYTF